MIKIFGIKNCDTMKKAFKWLDDNNIDYDFHDYKKLGADGDVLKIVIKEHGWENALNRRGTTWRKLDDTTKETMNEESALATALDNPSIIKRPIMVYKNKTYLGFKADEYQEILG